MDTMDILENNVLFFIYMRRFPRHD